MTQKKSSKNEATDIEETVETVPELEVKIEGEESEEVKEEIKEPPQQEEDVAALRKQIDSLKSAQETANRKALEAERQAQMLASQVSTFKHSAEQSQYDSIVTAMGAAQIEIDNAKRDIVLAGTAQDYQSLADAQERLAAAKAHMIGLEQGKQSYEQYNGNQSSFTDPVVESINQNPNLSYAEKSWLIEHKDAMADPRKNAKLNAAYFDALDKGLQRGSADYFHYIEEQLGYRQPEAKKQEIKNDDEEESPIMVAAPPNKGSGGTAFGDKKKTSFTLTKEEAEIAKLSGITPAEYVKQRELLREQKRVHPGDFPER